MKKTLIALFFGASTLALGGVTLIEKDAKPATITNIPEKVETLTNQFNFGDVPPHTSTVDSNGLIAIDVGDKKYTIEPLKLETDKAEGTKGKSTALKVESIGEDVYIKDAWGATTDIKLTNTKDTFSKVVSFSQDDFKNLAADTKFIEVKFQITGFEIPDGIYSNRIEIQPNVWLEKGKAWDSSPGDEANDIPNQNYTDVEFEVIGNTLIKRIPIEWFKTATFPVYTDAVFTFGTKQYVHPGPSITADVMTIGTNKYATCWVNNADTAQEVECNVTQVTGTSMATGTVVVAEADAIDLSAGNNNTMGACALGNDRFMVVYNEDGTTGDLGKARIASTTGTTINGFGPEFTFFSGTTTAPTCGYVDTDTVVIGYIDHTGQDMETVACSLSATSSLACGTPKLAYDSPFIASTDMTCTPNGTNRFICVYLEGNATLRLNAGTVSGTSITLGATTTLNAPGTWKGQSSGHNIVSLSDGNFIVSWSDSATVGNPPQSFSVGTVSVNTITMGATTTPLHNATTSASALIKIDGTNAFWIGQYGTTDSVTTSLVAIPIAVNFTTRTFSTSSPETINVTTDPGSLHAAQIGDCKFAFAWEDDNDTNDLFAIIGDTAGCVVDSVRDAGLIWFD